MIWKLSTQVVLRAGIWTCALFVAWFWCSCDPGRSFLPAEAFLQVAAAILAVIYTEEAWLFGSQSAVSNVTHGDCEEAVVYCQAAAILGLDVTVAIEPGIRYFRHPFLGEL